MITLKVQTGSSVSDKNIIEKALSTIDMECPVSEDKGYILVGVKKENTSLVKDYLKTQHGFYVSEF
jgi:hypothetical protein